VPFLQPDRAGQVEQPLLQARAGQPGQPGQRAADQPPHRVPPVQRRVRVLEHDLQRLELFPGPPRGDRAQLLAVELGH
jgi:hypothetical protein